MMLRCGGQCELMQQQQQQQQQQLNDLIDAAAQPAYASLS